MSHLNRASAIDDAWSRHLTSRKSTRDNSAFTLSTLSASTMPAAPAKSKKHAREVVKRLKREYPEATCALVHETPFELLIATILSAQCTDERVNIVTEDLFKKYSTPAALAAAPIPRLEKLIQSTGFFRNKAKNIHACCVKLVEEHA